MSYSIRVPVSSQFPPRRVHQGDLSRPRGRAFTLVELLVVIGIIGVLMAILLPVLGEARDRARRLQCANQLRTFGQAAAVYASQFKGKIPQHEGYANSPWDMPIGTRDAYMQFGGMQRDSFYCPSNHRFEAPYDHYWNYQPTFSIIGYWYMGHRPGMPMAPGAAFRPTLLQTIFPLRYADENRFIGKTTDKLGQTPPAALVFMADVTMSQDGDGSRYADGNFTHVAIGDGNYHGSSHVDRRGKPLGGHILFLDSHVEWRGFESMKDRFIDSNPHFWF